MARNGVMDLTRGMYRRLYAGFIYGERINKLETDLAEMWFWRLIIRADDFGNYTAEPAIVLAETKGRYNRRPLSDTDMARLLEDMARVDLIRFYEVAGSRYMHFVDFIEMQPAAQKNGRRVMKYPPSDYPDDVTEHERLGERRPAKRPPADTPTPANGTPPPPPQQQAQPSTPTPRPTRQPIEEGPDPIETEVATFIADHPSIDASTLKRGTQADLVKLVRVKGWAYAKRLIDQAVEQRASFPVAYAVGIWAKDEKSEAANSDRNGPDDQPVSKMTRYQI